MVNLTGNVAGGRRSKTMATSRRAFVAESGRYLPVLSVADLDGTSQASVRAQVVGRDGTLIDDSSGRPRRRD